MTRTFLALNQMSPGVGTMRRAGFAGGERHLDFWVEPSPLTRATQQSPLGIRHHELIFHLDPAQGSTGTRAVF